MAFILLREIALGKGILLDEEVVRHNAKAQLYAHLLEAHRAKGIDKSATVLRLVLPLALEHLDATDTRRIEELGLAIGRIVAPDLDIVCSEGYRLDIAVALGSRM